MKTERSPEERIVSAAIQCIEMVGIEAVTTRKIAQTAGVNNAAINYYFRSKNVLLERALATTTENAIGDWERIIADSAVPPADRLRSILQELLEGTQKFPNISKAHLHGPIMEGDFDTVFAQRFRSFIKLARDALAQALPTFKPAALELKLTLLFSAVMGWGLLGGMFAALPGADPERPECRERYLELLLSQFMGDGS